MKKIVPLLLLTVFIAACSSVMLTGRKQLNLVSDTELNQMSYVQYKKFIDTAPLSVDKNNTAMVKRVGSRVSAAVESYMKAHGYEKDIQNFAWEYNLVKDKQINAFCMPGGKVVVYDGILPVTQTETGLAVVLGHEIAHAVARHSSERLSQQMAIQYGGALTGVLTSGRSQAVQQTIGVLYGLGTQVGVLLPYSRTQELEADQLGLIFMAMAGYDPNQAIPFWQRMSANSGKGDSSDFLSTHPSDSKRISKIQQNLPEALKYYRTGTVPSTSVKR